MKNNLTGAFTQTQLMGNMDLSNYSQETLNQIGDILNVLNSDLGQMLNTNNELVSQYSDLLSMGYMSRNEDGQILSMNETSDRIKPMLQNIVNENSLDLRRNEDRMLMMEKALGEINTNKDFAFDSNQLAQCINISRSIDDAQYLNPNDFDASSKRPAFNQKLSENLNDVFGIRYDDASQNKNVDALVNRINDKNKLTMNLYNVYNQEERNWPENDRTPQRYEFGDSGKDLAGKQMEFATRTSGSIDLLGINGSQDSRKFLLGLGLSNLVNDGLNYGTEASDKSDEIRGNINDFLENLHNGNPNPSDPFRTDITFDVEDTINDGINKGLDSGKLTRNIYSAIEKDELIEPDLQINVSKDLSDPGSVRNPNEKVIAEYSNLLSMGYAARDDDYNILPLDETADKIRPMLQDIVSENNLDLSKESDRIQLGEKALGELNMSEDFAFSQERLTACIGISRALEDAKNLSSEDFSIDETDPRPEYNQKLSSLLEAFPNVAENPESLDALISMNDDPNKLTMAIYSEMVGSDEDIDFNNEPDKLYEQRSEYGIGERDQDFAGKQMGFAAQSMGTADLLGENAGAESRKSLMGLGLNMAINQGMTLDGNPEEKVEMAQDQVYDLMNGIRGKSPFLEKYTDEPEFELSALDGLSLNDSADDVSKNIYSKLEEKGLIPEDLKVNERQGDSIANLAQTARTNEDMVSKYSDLLSMGYMTKNSEGEIQSLNETSDKIKSIMNDIVNENSLDLNKVEDRMSLMEKTVGELNSNENFAFSSTRLANCINTSKYIENAQMPSENDYFDPDSKRPEFNQKLGETIGEVYLDGEINEQDLDTLIQNNQNPTKLTMAVYSQYGLSNDEWPEEQLNMGKDAGFASRTAGLVDLSGNDSNESRKLLFGLGLSNAVNIGLNQSEDRESQIGDVRDNVYDFVSGTIPSSLSNEQLVPEYSGSTFDDLIEDALENMDTKDPSVMASKLYSTLEDNDLVSNDMKIDMSKDLYDEHTDFAKNPNEKMISQYSSLMAMGYTGRTQDDESLSMEDTEKKIKSIMRDVVKENDLDLSKEEDRKVFADKTLKEMNIGDDFIYSNDKLTECINISRAIDEAKQPNEEFEFDQESGRPRFNQQFEEMLENVLPGADIDSEQLDKLIAEHDDPTKLTMAIHSQFGDPVQEEWPVLDEEELAQGSTQMDFISDTIASTDLLGENNSEASRKVLTSIGINESVRNGFNQGYDGESRSESVKDNVSDFLRDINESQPNQDKYEEKYDDGLSEKLDEIVPDDLDIGKKINPGKFANEICSKLNKQDYMPEDLKIENNTNQTKGQSNGKPKSFAELWDNIKDNIKENSGAKDKENKTAEKSKAKSNIDR